MADEVGRAGFHARHTKAVGERKAILHEMMRELDPDSIAYWAERNPNIVVEDEPLNVALVNDGEGGMRPCTDREEVIAYGEARLAKVGRKITADRWDAKEQKWKGGTVTTTAIVCHLPKSLCIEVPDFYPRRHRDGSPMLDVNGEQMYRSRWVARDRDEMLRYFVDVRAYLCAQVVPGGQAALLGEDIQVSESTPHDQFMFDAFAEDPKKPGTLRAAASDAYFSSRNVRDGQGRQKGGKAKFRDYHAGLKAYLIEKGWDISADFDEARHMTGDEKATYELLQDQLAAAEEAKRAAQLDIANAALLTAKASQRDDRAKADAYLAADARKDAARYLHAAKRDAAAERADWAEPDEHGQGEGPKRRQAREEARQEGYDAGLAEGRADATQDRQRAAQELRAAQAAKAALDRARADWEAEAPTRAVLLNEWLDRRLKGGGTRRDRFDAYTKQVADEWVAAHRADVEVLEDADFAALVTGGTAALDEALAEAQRDKGLR